MPRCGVILIDQRIVEIAYMPRCGVSLIDQRIVEITCRIRGIILIKFVKDHHDLAFLASLFLSLISSSAQALSLSKPRCQIIHM